MTKNEEKNIKKCLRSLTSFEEVFVVDSGSTDNTCEIAEGHGATVVPFSWNGKYPKKKQWCLDNLPFSNDWVLYVDADEELYPETAEEIRSVMEAGGGVAGYFVGYDYAFTGKVLKHGHRVYKLVLFDRRKGRFLDYDDLDAANMWEVEGHYQPSIEGKTAVLKSRMLHNDHEDLYHFFYKLNRYSDWEAVLRVKHMLRDSKQATMKRRGLLQKVGDRMPLKGLAIFLYGYVFRFGFLDGVPGLHYSLALGIYYSMISMKCRELKLQDKD